MKKPALKKEDGATFFAIIEELDTGEIRACCYAQIDHGHSVETEEPDYMMCESIDAARKWTDAQAFHRRFTSYKLTSPRGISNADLLPR